MGLRHAEIVNAPNSNVSPCSSVPPTSCHPFSFQPVRRPRSDEAAPVATRGGCPTVVTCGEGGEVGPVAATGMTVSNVRRRYQ